MKKEESNQFTGISNRLTRLDLGEAWMWCTECMSKLYSFDGHEDEYRPCPHPVNCEDAKAKIRENR